MVKRNGQAATRLRGVRHGDKWYEEKTENDAMHKAAAEEGGDAIPFASDSWCRLFAVVPSSEVTLKKGTTLKVSPLFC
ncbi:hypothetical protein [Synechococcus sp. RS9902]|uniref:hypothetical protein n=1 Tax=Synechococcus sp. RS9902 TaxID=221345 RepID=UPI001647EB9B|nr:hypothetical protein [Synechococcus sp. RS9902]